MKDWQLRLKTEYHELSGRITKLTDFIYTSADYFNSLSVDEQVRLKLQFTYMKAYWGVLKDRLDSLE